MKCLFLLPFAAAVLAGCASGAIKTGASGGPGGQEVQLRLKRLADAGVPGTNFSLAKAQCWLDSAHTQRSENDRTGYVEEAVAEAARIAAALEADRNTDAGRATPLIRAQHASARGFVGPARQDGRKRPSAVVQRPYRGLRPGPAGAGRARA